jgi:short-subunit dehydrogenase
VLALTQSMHHELADKNIKVQAVLPGATATDFWEISGTPLEYVPQSWVMSAEDMVDASLAGFDAGELVTLPAVEDAALVDNLEAARRALFDKMSGVSPASRYGAKSKIAA